MKELRRQHDQRQQQQQQLRAGGGSVGGGGGGGAQARLDRARVAQQHVSECTIQALQLRCQRTPKKCFDRVLLQAESRAMQTKFVVFKSALTTLLYI